MFKPNKADFGQSMKYVNGRPSVSSGLPGVFLNNYPNL